MCFADAYQPKTTESTLPQNWVCSAGNLVQWKIIDPNKRVYVWALVAKTVKNLPAVQETQVQSLGWEDPLEKRMATHSSIIAWRIPWTEEPGGLQSMG